VIDLKPEVDDLLERISLASPQKRSTITGQGEWPFALTRRLSLFSRRGPQCQSARSVRKRVIFLNAGDGARRVGAMHLTLCGRTSYCLGTVVKRSSESLQEITSSMEVGGC
jgi:hypothetical protein